METALKPPTGKKLKARAPPPPIQASISRPPMEQRSSSEFDGTDNQSPEDIKENMLHRKMDLTICLPDGRGKTVTVDGSKAVMDLLVDICSQYHLNPAHHTIEAKSGECQQPFTLRPNTLIGTLDVQTVCLKEKVTEIKVKKPAPMIPEKTVRLVVNFLGTQKTVVRVNPEVPLQSILLAICEKCEFQPEDVILLRDTTNKEELDMAKSLKVLGIKELYAWNSKKEKKRNSSTNSDNTEKEKKGILGFFRSHKKNKNEGNTGSMENEEYEEIFKAASTTGTTHDGCSTAPSSPAVNTRPVTLGASVSLYNISSIGAKPEVKKRRAPPPPKPTPFEAVVEKNMDQKTPEQLLPGIQNEQQKKKRRAPPPPTAPMPNDKNEEKEENGKSSTGNGRQVPQKPPRGTTRSPPLLVIPPPPPYPPPDYGNLDPPVTENGVVVTEQPKFVPVPAKRDISLKRFNSVSSVEILTVDSMEADEAGSIRSYTEDSGVVSSLSDSASLDLPSDSTQSRESLLNQENAKESVRTDIHKNNKSSNMQTRRDDDDDVTSVRNGDEDIFISAQFQKTLEELDDDSEDMDDVDSAYRNHIHSQSSPFHKQESMTYTEVPVTIIDGVPDMENEVTSNSQRVELHTNYTKQGALKPEQNASTAFKLENGYNHRESKPTETIPSSMPRSKFASAKKAEFSETRLIENKDKTEKQQIPASLNNTTKGAEPSKPVLWRQQTYESKAGMRTFTVVPPKPDVKKYDRGASLSASAIKIDDFGNLISPHTSISKKDLNNSHSNKPQGPLVEKAKEFWRSNSMDSQAGEVREQFPKKFSSVKSNKPNQQEADSKINYISQVINKGGETKEQPSIKNNKPNQQGQMDTLNYPSLKGVALNTITERENGHLKQLHSIPGSQEKMIIIEHTNSVKSNPPFLNIQKRTSSQYVASAISKYTEPSRSKSFETNDSIKQETTADLRKRFSGIYVPAGSNPSKTAAEKNNKSNDHSQIYAQRESSVSEQQGFSEIQSRVGTTAITILERNPEKTSMFHSAPHESQGRLNTISSSNSFLKAVREKSGKMEQSNSYTSNKEPLRSVAIKEDKGNDVPSTITDDTDNPSNGDVFGPKAKLRQVVQKPFQKDTTLHSALMEAIQSGEGKEKLRKIQTSSAVLNELQSVRNAEPSFKEAEKVHNQLQSIPPPPLMPPPPPPPVLNLSATVSPATKANSVNAREALMDAIRSGAGAARLKKVSTVYGLRK
ncbi:cordon-bleu WH2 repeat protein L homeolog isoform X2 [Xenopus laevis]|uniref:Cordon-bleu WH2 repeat protein L homeolog isoform X2 n=1 Tax=Xenopus laevis TaxID=8355 RepID=A0A8J0VH51_XENLA|nr:cordon-bleu WH2 repeat protein L homeolog isoform X2 [Xenopus laevis]